jgi:MoxR-like ATPase
MTAPLSAPEPMPAAAVIADAEKAMARLAAVKAAVGHVIYGQQHVVDQALITVLAGGHGLLVGVPGLAKTKLVATLGCVLGLDQQRIQFTPDLMPSDILGSEVMDEDGQGKRQFRFVKGPVFTQLLMADEINRASPRTQSALLQAMQEYHVTIAGQRYDVPRPFHVLATQDPLEQEGTYPLPEAQLDRFLMQIDIEYPDRATEKQILIETTGAYDVAPEAILSGAELRSLQDLVRRMPVGGMVVEAILDLVRGARPQMGQDNLVSRSLAWGPGPRAAQALMLAVRARALLDGRVAPSRDDVIALAEPALKHRMALHVSARAQGLNLSIIIKSLCEGLG